MDIIKFNNPTDPVKMEQGEIINGISSKMWIERYRDAGEFTLKAPVSTGLKDKLSIGSFISHVDTAEIMIVENHEISEDQEKEPDIIITGRGLETFLENRIVGSNNVFPMATEDLSFELAANYTWVQAVNLIIAHIYESELDDPGDALPFTTVLTSVSGASVSIPRKISKGYLYERLMELLGYDDLGIKVFRPGLYSPLGPTDPNVAILIHVGNDKTQEVVMAYDTGEIVTADYLWSIKTMKNSALISGKYVQTVVNLGPTGYDRRMMFVDASDIDEGLTEPPTGPDIITIADQMEQRGIEFLATQNSIALTKAEVSREATNAIYRVDFDVGDWITVNGNYNESSPMRVSEYVEIEDETGASGYPTLTEE